MKKRKKVKKRRKEKKEKVHLLSLIYLYTYLCANRKESYPELSLINGSPKNGSEHSKLTNSYFPNNTHNCNGVTSPLCKEMDSFINHNVKQENINSKNQTAEMVCAALSMMNLSSMATVRVRKRMGPKMETTPIKLQHRVHPLRDAPVEEEEVVIKKREEKEKQDVCKIHN